MNHWAVPPNVVKATKAAEMAVQGVKAQGQQQLAFKTMIGPREFTRAGTLDAVAKLIATNNQVSFFKSYIRLGTHYRNIPSLLRLQITLHSGIALSR